MKRPLGYNAAYTLKCAMEKLKKVICSHNFLLSHEKNYFHLFMTIFLTHSWGKQCVSKRKTWNHSQARDSKLFFFQHTVFPTPDPENQSFTGENVFLIEKTENYVNKVPFPPRLRILYARSIFLFTLKYSLVKPSQTFPLVLN